MNKIIEKRFKIESGEPFTELLLDSYRVYCDVDSWEKRDRWGQMVYIDTEPKQVVVGFTSTRYVNTELNFCTLLKNIEFSDFRKLLLFVTTYSKYFKLSEHADLTLKNANAKIDMLLQETNGWIVYKYQLEELIRMTSNYNVVEAQNLRKKINQKRLDGFAELSEIKINGGNLKTYIFERMKLGTVCSPNYASTHCLFNYLNSKQ